MNATRRTASVVGAAVGVGTSLVMLAGAANAAPYADTPSISVSTGNPDVGGSLTVTGDGYGFGENVAIDLHSTTVRLVVTAADGTGQFSVRVKLPSGFKCNHVISGTGVTTGRGANANIVIGSCDKDDDDHSDGGHRDHENHHGSLPKTGAEVAGTALLGAALIGGGAVLRRRQKTGV